MKKIVGLLAVISCLSSCDDGDMVFENLNFDGKEIQKCDDNELYFKTNDRELLLVDFTRKDSDTTKIQSWLVPTAELNKNNVLKTVGSLKILYRTYDAAVNKSSICSLLAPANPKVTSEYTSISGGTINYTRTMAPVVTEGTVSVTYTYIINFENITLTNGSSEIKYTTFPFGSYIYDTSKLSFNFMTNFKLCNNNGSILTGNTNNEILQLKLPDNFVFPTVKQTQTINLSSTNSLRYFLYKKNLILTDSCELPSANDNPIKEDWKSLNGSIIIESSPIVNNTSGEISGYKHIIKITQAQFTKDSGSFVITNKIIGEYNILNP